MSVLLRTAVEIRKKAIIDKLLYSGIYKKGEVHLYELCLSDLEKELMVVSGKEVRYEKKIF